MSKVGQDNVELSPRAEGILKDINSLPGRVSSYKDSIVQLKPTTAEERILHFDAHLSVIEGLGSKAIRENSPASTIDSLIDVIHESNKAYSKFANEVDKAKLNVNAAKTEAALKGFVLPLSIGGPSNELDSFGLNTDEYKIAMQATKTAILELANKHISKEDYAEEIRKRAQEILKSDPQAFSTEKLEQFDKFIGQGKQIKKPSKLTDPELEAIALATAKSVDSLSNSIIKDTQSVPSIVLVNDVIKQMEKQHKVKFTPERVEKLMKNLVPTLTKLGPEYLEAHKATLTRELSSSLRSGQGFISQATGTYSISNSELEKITNKMNKASLEVSNNTVKTVIGRMSDSEITGKLNAFAKEAGGKTFDKAPTVEDIDKIRLSNPKKFDQIFNAPKPLSPDLQEKAHNAPTKSTSPRPPAYPPPKPPATKGQGGGHVM